jgi:hypothetical protein
MANQRTTFAKRQREQNRKDKARAKQERLASRRASSTGEKGPPIAWDEAAGVDATTDPTSDPAPAPTGDDVPSDGSP